MTEFELITLVLERRNEVVSLLQWWASISVGIIAASQLLQRFLNMILLIILIFFYLVFTFATFRLSGALSRQMLAAFEDLSKLEEPSAQAMLMIHHYSSGYISDTQSILLGILLIVTVATCAYPIWVYRKSGT